MSAIRVPIDTNGVTPGQTLAWDNTAKAFLPVTPSGGGASWAKKTSTYTAVAGDNILADTSGGAFTINLPASPSTNQVVTIKSGAFAATSNLTIGRNGSTIMGLAEDMIVALPNVGFALIYDGATWRL